MTTDEHGSRSRTRLVAWCAALGALFVALLVGAPASAHSTLVRSDPAEGGTVAVGRTELSLWFGEPIETAASSFRLLTESGEVLPATISGSTTSAAEFVQLETPALTRGVLRLEWRAISADDGHSSAGALTFGAGIRPPPTAGSAGAPPVVSEVVLRWVQLTTLLLALGALLAPGLLRRGGNLVPAAPRRALRLGSFATLAALIATLLTPVISAEQSSNPFGDLTSTRWGRLWLLHVLALVAATLAYSALARRGPSPRRLGVAGSCLAVAAVADAAAGHSAELLRSPAIAVAATTVHVLAAGVWVGTLAVLAACLLPEMRRSPDLRRPLLASTWRAFGPVAAVSVGLLTASGVYLAGRQLPGLSALAGSWYGVAAAGKVVLLSLALVVAAGTALASDPQLARLLARRTPLTVQAPATNRFPRRVVAELALLGTAVVLAAVMTSVPRPLVGGSPTAPPATATVDGLFVSFESVPAGKATSRLIVRVNAVTRPQPGPVTGVDVLVQAPGSPSTSATLTPIEPGRFETTVPAPAADQLHVWVSLHRPAVQDTVAGLDWSWKPPSTSGRTQLEGITTPLAGLALIVGLVLLVVAGSRRREAAADDSRPEPETVGAERTRPHA